jgi:peptidyl-prolyl cis-trans isomerase D
MFRTKNTTIDKVDTAKLAKNSGTYIVLLLALGAMTFFGVCDPQSRRGGGMRFGSQAAIVGDQVISNDEFRRAYRNAYDQYQKQLSDKFDPAAMQLAHNVIQQLVNDRILYSSAVRHGLKASDEEVEKVLAEAALFKDDKGQFSEENFTTFMRGNGYTEASFMEEVRRNISLQKFRRFITDTAFVSTKAAEIDYRLAETKLNLEFLKFDPQKVNVEVTDADVDKFLQDDKNKERVKEYYETNKRDFNQAEQVKARHILVSFKGARNATPEAAKRSKEEAKKRADEIYAKVKAPGADFIAVAKAKTDEAAGKASGGDLGFFAREAMVKEFSDAAFKLSKNEISAPVESPFGFHIIKVEDKKEAKNTTLEAAQRGIAKTIIGKDKKPELAKANAEQVLAALKAKKDPADLLAKYDTKWAETGDFAANTRYIPSIGTSDEINDALLSLKSVGQLVDKVVDVRGNFFIVRLKSRKDADMSKFDDKKSKELAESASYSEGYALFNSLEKKLKDEMQKDSKVWMNPDVLAIDNRKEEATSPEG